MTPRIIRYILILTFSIMNYSQSIDTHSYEGKLTFKVPQTKDYKYQLSICAIFKDEAPYFKEWIEYHKIVGVEHFYLYNNDSTDNYIDTLKDYIDTNEVTLVDWPSDPSKLGPKEWVPETQWPAMVHGIQQATGESKWLAIIDIDEFILPLTAPDIPRFLAGYENFPCIVINWQCYGTSNIPDIPEGQLLIETLTYKALPKSKWNIAVKAILKPECVDINNRAWCPHTWTLLAFTKHLVYANYETYQFGEICTDNIIINHYVHRTENYYNNIKLAKKRRMEGVKWDDTFIKEYHDECNLVEDKSIFKHVPRLREIIFQ